MSLSVIPSADTWEKCVCRGFFVCKNTELYVSETNYDDIVAIMKEKQRLFSRMAWIYASEDAGYHSTDRGRKRNNLLPVKMLVT